MQRRRENARGTEISLLGKEIATQFISMQTRNYKQPPESKNKQTNKPETREHRRT